LKKYEHLTGFFAELALAVRLVISLKRTATPTNDMPSSASRPNPQIDGLLTRTRIFPAAKLMQPLLFADPDHLHH